MHKNELIPKLERTAMFDEFKRDEYEALVGYLQVQKVDAGALIFREGEKGSRMCLLLDGRLEVFRPSRVLLQDFTGVPAVVDLAAMRDALHP